MFGAGVVVVRRTRGGLVIRPAPSFWLWAHRPTARFETRRRFAGLGAFRLLLSFSLCGWAVCACSPKMDVVYFWIVMSQRGRKAWLITWEDFGRHWRLKKRRVVALLPPRLSARDAKQIVVALWCAQADLTLSERMGFSLSREHRFLFEEGGFQPVRQ